MPNTTNPPSMTDVLRDMADEHIGYEVSKTMLFAYWANGWVYNYGVPEPLAKFAAESMLEATTIHVRNVVEFLTLPKPKQQRVVAAQYFGGKWTPSKPLRFPVAELRPIHKRVAHLTTERVSVSTDGPFHWGEFIVQTLPLALEDFRVFLTDLAAHDAERAGWFANTDAMLSQGGW